MYIFIVVGQSNFFLLQFPNNGSSYYLMVDPNRFGYAVQKDEVSGCPIVIYFHTAMINASKLYCKLFIMLCVLGKV